MLVRGLRIKPRPFFFALRAAIAMALVAFLALFFHFKAPYWAVITVVVIMSVSHQASIDRGLQRIIGTLLGALLALVLIDVVSQNTVSFLLVVFLVSFVCYYLFQTYKYQYAVLLGLATFLLVYASMLSGDAISFDVAVWRCCEIVLGVTVVFIVATLTTLKRYRENVVLTEIEKSNWSLNVVALKHALKSVIATELAIVVWLFSDWPGGIQGIISSLVVSAKTDLVVMRSTAWERLLGCLLGGGIGLFCLHFVAFDLVILLTLVFSFGLLFCYLMYASPRHMYIGLQANVAFALTLVQAGGPTQNIAPGLERLSGIFLGVIVGLLVHHLFSRQQSA